MLISRGLLTLLSWGLLFGLLWQLFRAAQAAIAAAQHMHQIPCTRCQFFTWDYRLKCTVNPSEANTPSAIGCRDFQS
ncbi:MAG: hypothetical protein F6J87_19200 [Spirulina sp. SIO3F2]|nr:hypothetical protein [Spirulina sp. SIO3F2]